MSDTLDHATMHAVPEGMRTALEFPLVEALMGRRARRFALGDTIPDGPLAFASRHDPVPLSRLEQLMLLTAAGGTTGWHFAITRNERYAPHLANYAGAAGGRTFPSAAGFHTSELFYTDDDGVYVIKNRDAAPATTENGAPPAMEDVLEAHARRIHKIQDGRLHIPAREPYMEGHNTWCANVPGSTMVIPVADVAQHMIAGLCFLTQNGYCLFDDVHDERIPGIEAFRSLVDVDDPLPLTFIEQYMLTEATAELSASCYAGVLMLQAMGLGGWMFDGIDRHVVLGASGDPEVPGLGFRFDEDERWSIPNVTGLEGVFEGSCPPHVPDMATAVAAFTRRKFGPGGPFNRRTPGAWRESAIVRGSAQPHSEEFQACVALQAQYVLDRFGKFPGTVPTIFCLTYLQAHHLDLDFYDHHFQPGSGYLRTHAEHMHAWHDERARPS